MPRSEEEQRIYDEWWEQWERRPDSEKFASEEDRIKYEEHRRLYEQYGKQFEKESFGQYIAIGFDGQVIIGPDDNEVGKKAVEQIGRAQFYLGRLGYRVTYEWGG